MHVYMSITIVLLSLIIVLMGSVNLIRAFYFKSKRIKAICLGLSACVFRNIFMWGLLNLIFSGAASYNEPKEDLFGMFILCAYIVINKTFMIAQLGKYTVSLYLGSVLFNLTAISFLSIIIKLLDDSNIVYSIQHQSILVLLTGLILISFTADLNSAQFERSIRSPLESEDLKKTLITALRKIEEREYEISSVENIISTEMPVFIMQRDLSGMVVLDRKFIDKNPIRAVEYTVVRKTIDYIAGYIDIFIFLDVGSLFMLFLTYSVLVFEHFSHLPIILRCIVCYEIHEIVNQIKNIIFTVACAFIERDTTKKIKKYVDYSKPLSNKEFESILFCSEEFSLNKTLRLGYDYVLYGYHANERVRDLGIALKREVGPLQETQNVHRI